MARSSILVALISSIKHRIVWIRDTPLCVELLGYTHGLFRVDPHLARGLLLQLLGGKERGIEVTGACESVCLYVCAHAC